MISFEKIGLEPATGRIRWKLINENGLEHVHKEPAGDSDPNNIGFSTRKRIADLATVTDLAEARRLLALGWEYKTSYPATIANVPHYVLVKKE